jgi:serine-type D-Ala-D-Ala carboxypeptidase (penicillin-binding protein 5/6)
MRNTSRVAASTVAAGMVAGLIVAAGPAARAAERPQVASAPTGVHAPYAELANELTGADLFSRSSVSEHPMGSITKVMTAYVVIEAGDLNRVITVPSGIVGYDDAYGASTAGLVPGEKLTALQLLYALLLPSGCDAAYTLATAYGKGGSRAQFIAQMNATAKKLGLSKTHFSDFSGLPDPGEYTTYSDVRDLVSLGRDAMKLATFRSVVGTRSYRLAADKEHYAHVWDNLNPLLGSYSGATGIKTGFTSAAGDCLLFAATRGKTELIGVVLDSSSSDSMAGLGVAGADAARMLNWGFSRS